MPRFILNLHAQRQAHRRQISYEDIEFVLDNHDLRRPARILSGRAPSEIFVATVRDNRFVFTWR